VRFFSLEKSILNFIIFHIEEIIIQLKLTN